MVELLCGQTPLTFSSQNEGVNSGHFCPSHLNGKMFPNYPELTLVYSLQHGIYMFNYMCLVRQKTFSI